MSSGRPAWLREVILRPVRELLLGARMALAGGVGGWVRAGLTALGVGLGVAMLLVTVSAPDAIAAWGERTAARDDLSYDEPPPKSDTTILVGSADTHFRDQPIRGRLLQADGVPPTVGDSRMYGAPSAHGDLRR